MKKEVMSLEERELYEKIRGKKCCNYNTTKIKRRNSLLLHVLSTELLIVKIREIWD